MDKNSFLDNIKYFEPNDQQKAKLYETYKNQQEGQFELYINYINEVLCILKDYRIVSDFTKFNARIKAPESAIANDDEEKALDDVFGMEVDFATPGEKFFVSELIKGTLNTIQEKIHKKDNGYEAYHLMGHPVSKKVIVNTFENLLNRKIDPKEEFDIFYEGLSEKNRQLTDSEKEKKMKYFEEFKDSFEPYSSSIKTRMSDKYMRQLKNDLQIAEEVYLQKQEETGSNENIPFIEFQSKTIQVAIEANIGEARHDGYKGLTSEEMQKVYDALNGKIPLSQVPTMYTSDLKRDENGKIIPMRIRSSHKTLKTLYPGLITKRAREEGRGV